MNIRSKIMRFSISALVFIFLSGYSIAQSVGKRHIFIIDKTGSMLGLGSGGTANIWDKVKNSIISNVNDIPDNNEVIVYTFHSIVDLPPSKIVLNSKDDKKRVIDFINNIKADGKRTCVYASLKTILSDMDTTRNNIIKLYTDGKNNCEGVTLKEALKEYSKSKGPNDWLFYLALGFAPTPQDITEFVKEPQTSIILSPEGEVPFIIDIFPKNPVLKFQRVELTWEQGFDVIGRKNLPKDFN